MHVQKQLLGNYIDLDSILKDLSELINKKQPLVNAESLISLLLSKDEQIKSLLPTVSQQVQRYRKITILKDKCTEADSKIEACQTNLRKCEFVLSTALYYSRQKVESMTKSVKNPINTEELVKFSHKISASNGAVAPANWNETDTRRPYPSKGVIRSGYLGHLDDNGNFRPSVIDAFNKMLPHSYPTGQSSNSTDRHVIDMMGGACETNF